MVFYIIATQPRMGTHLLQSLLNSNVNDCYGELLNIDVKSRLKKKMPYLYESETAEQFWERFINIRKKHKKQAIGFCLHPWHLSKNDKAIYPESEQAILRHNWKIIKLARKNLLAVYSSHKIAKSTKIWHVPNKKDKPASCKIDFNISEFYQEVRNIINGYIYTSNWMHKYSKCLIWYEDLCKDRLLELTAINNFLNCDTPNNITTKYEIQNPSNLRDRFNNWKVVLDSLAGTYWEGCLYNKPPNWVESINESKMFVELFANA